MVDVWVCNSSPLIALARIQRLDLIESLRAYGEAAPRTAPEHTLGYVRSGSAGAASQTPGSSAVGKSKSGGPYPGGQASTRPAKTCRCTCNTDCPASAPAFITTRNPPSA